MVYILRILYYNEKGKTVSVFPFFIQKSEEWAMLRVVLADDEHKIILLLQKLIQWERLGYEIVGTADNGLRSWCGKSSPTC